MPVRFLIVDDHEPVRQGIRSLLTRRSDWAVCGEATNGLEAVDFARKLRPDIVLMDLSMPRMDGAEATRIIRQDVPEAKVIVVSQTIRQSFATWPPKLGRAPMFPKPRSLATCFPQSQR